MNTINGGVSEPPRKKTTVSLHLYYFIYIHKDQYNIYIKFVYVGKVVDGIGCGTSKDQSSREYHRKVQRRQSRR